MVAWLRMDGQVCAFVRVAVAVCSVFLAFTCVFVCCVLLVCVYVAYECVCFGRSDFSSCHWRSPLFLLSQFNCFVDFVLCSVVCFV